MSWDESGSAAVAVQCMRQPNRNTGGRHRAMRPLLDAVENEVACEAFVSANRIVTSGWDREEPRRRCSARWTRRIEPDAARDGDIAAPWVGSCGMFPTGEPDRPLRHPFELSPPHPVPDHGARSRFLEVVSFAEGPGSHACAVPRLQGGSRDAPQPVWSPNKGDVREPHRTGAGPCASS